MEREGVHMLRRDISTALLATATGAALLPKSATAQTCTAPCYAQTAAEITAGITPVNTSYPPLWADRYGTNTTPGTTNMATAIQNAIKVAAVAGATGNTGMGVILQATTYLVNSTIVIPGGVTVRGAGGSGVGVGSTTGIGTNILFTGVEGTAAFCLGNSNAALSYFPALADLAITLATTTGGTWGVQFLCSVNGSARNIFVFSNPALVNSGFLISGGTAASGVSCFFNTLTNCYAQHVYEGYAFNSLAAGNTEATQTTFLQCAALGLGDTTGYGLVFAQPGQGYASGFHGCYFENFGTGVYFNTTNSVNFYGTQFEGCGNDIAWSGSDQAVTFFGLYAPTQTGTPGTACGVLNG
ncbi:MAG: hypothetical protein WCA14_08175 [Steroidobacteraceae bacterium]